MFKFSNPFKKQKSILTEEDQKELEELERESFMKEARQLIVTRGAQKAKMQLTLKQKKKPEDDYS